MLACGCLEEHKTRPSQNTFYQKPSTELYRIPHACLGVSTLEYMTVRSLFDFKRVFFSLGSRSTTGQPDQQLCAQILPGVSFSHYCLQPQLRSSKQRASEERPRTTWQTRIVPLSHIKSEYYYLPTHCVTITRPWDIPQQNFQGTLQVS